MLKEMFGEETMRTTQVLSGFPESKVVWPTLKILSAWDVHQQTEENVEQVKKSFLKNRRITTHDVGNMFGISYDSVQSIPKENTRWFKYDRDWLCVNKSQFVPVIFEPPCYEHPSDCY
jgi:hypothetical protein